MAGMLVGSSFLAASRRLTVPASKTSTSCSNCGTHVAARLPHAKLVRRNGSLLGKILCTLSHPVAQTYNASSISSRKKAAESRAEIGEIGEIGDNVDLNLEELDDEQLEKLFETYGEVIKADPEPVTSEVDDDAESLALAVALAEVANEVKAGDIRVLCVKPLVYWTRFFVIATGFSRPQVDAIGKRMRDLAAESYKRKPCGDLKPNAWTLLDFGDVVVHIFYPKERAFYNLEEFYANAPSVELPFESQSTMHQ